MQIGKVTEFNMAALTKSSDWSYEAGAIYTCNEKSFFKRYAKIEETKEVIMANAKFHLSN